MINALKNSITHEVTKCDNPDLLDLIYKLLLVEGKEDTKNGDKSHRPKSERKL